MKKIVFVDIPMKEMSSGRDSQCYAGTGSAGCAYSGKVIFSPSTPCLRRS